MIQDMLWSVLPWMNKDGMHRHPRRSVATAVRLLLFGVGCCIAYVVCQSCLLPDLYCQIFCVICDLTGAQWADFSCNASL